MIFFDDAVKQRKLEEAISLGYITMRQQPNGAAVYELTIAGMQRWILERMGAA